MDYIYDIVLNFQPQYYEFYEWKESDKIINIKKILVYLVNNDDYLNLKYNEVILEYPNKTKMFLVTNGLEVMAILLDNFGKIIKRSSLVFDEAEEVIEEKDTIKSISIKYKKNIPKKYTLNSRIIKEKINFLEKYFSNIDKIKNEYLLKYIYYDIYNIEEKDINKIYDKLKESINSDTKKIYDSIKKISIELK